MSGSCHIIVASASPPPTLLHRIYMGVAVLLPFEFYDYPLLLSVLFCTWHPPSLSSYFLFPLHHPPHPSVRFGLLWKGDGRRGGKWKRGMGMRREGKRAWKAGQRGVSGCKRERKMIVRVCQWELSPLTDSVLVPLILSDVRAGLFIQSFGDTHMHCMKILSALFFFFFYSTSSSSSLTTVVFRNVFMWAHFHSGEGLFSPRSRPQPPCLMPLHWVVCTFELNIKICCPVCSLLPSPFTSARLRFLPSLVTCFNLPNCFPSSSVRCHWWRGTSASLVGGLWRGKEDYFSN